MMHQRATRPSAAAPQVSKSEATPGANRVGSAGGSLASVIGDGRPLVPELRTSMERRFARDLSHVRIHSDRPAGMLADAVGARAFTLRNHIVFGTGNFAPHDSAGRRLIVHELTHVAQQQPDAVEAGLPPDLNGLAASRRGDAAEQEAESATTAADHEEPIQVRERVRDTVQGDWLGAGIGALVGGAAGAGLGYLIGGPLGALIGGGIGLVAGALIGGLSGGFFPSYSEIVADAAVQARITSAWASTEAAATPATRREEGFWIRLNKATNAYEFTSTILGPSVGPTQGGAVNLGARPADTNPGTNNAVYSVASFHTHTPTAFRPTGRAIGPSAVDNQIDTSDDVVGVVYDYVGSPAGSPNIPAGHPIGSPARAYHSGPNRRQRR